MQSLAGGSHHATLPADSTQIAGCGANKAWKAAGDCFYNPLVKAVAGLIPAARGGRTGV